MNDREELTRKLLLKLHQYKYGKTAMEAGKTMSLTEGHAETLELADFITEQTRLARISERNEIALDNYRGQTFSDSTNWKGKFEKFIENNERRLAQLAPKPKTP